MQAICRNYILITLYLLAILRNLGVHIGTENAFHSNNIMHLYNTPIINRIFKLPLSLYTIPIRLCLIYILDL